MVYRSGDLEIDRVRRRVRQQGEVRFLRPKTFDFLLHLLENRDRLVSRAELAERVWTGLPMTDGLLVQAVNDVREALQDNAREPRYLQVVSGEGYRFIGEVTESEAPPDVPEPRVPAAAPRRRPVFPDPREEEPPDRPLSWLRIAIRILIVLLAGLALSALLVPRWFGS